MNRFDLNICLECTRRERELWEIEKKLSTQKQLHLTCPQCLATYKLLEIHQAQSNNCPHNCLAQWRKLLHSHYQEQIILYLAQEEAKQDQNHPDHEKK